MKSSTGILTIDLAAIQANWLRINQQLNSSQTAAAAVIKADAYGLGAAYVGPALYAAGCREFFIATVEEAIAARQYLPSDARLYVLGGVRAGAEEQFLQHHLIPVLFSLPDLRRWQNVCALQEVSGACAIKINTGMTRLGLDIEEFAALMASPESMANLYPVLVMSHLACADDFDHPLNRSQLNSFLNVIDLCKNILPDVRFSLANSSGIYLGQEWHFDLVRSGAALYGINPQPRSASVMEPVVQLDLPVLQLRHLHEDSCVGYGATVQLPPPTTLAVVAGGYADGLHRVIGTQGLGMMGSYFVAVVGRISMDTTIFDVSSVPVDQMDDAFIQVLNKQLTVDLMIERNGALGYEVLTSLGNRYRRYYLSMQNVLSKQDMSNGDE